MTKEELEKKINEIAGLVDEIDTAIHEVLNLRKRISNLIDDIPDPLEFENSEE